MGEVPNYNIFSHESNVIVLSLRANSGDFFILSWALLIVEHELNSEMSVSESKDFSENMHFFFEIS